MDDVDIDIEGEETRPPTRGASDTSTHKGLEDNSDSLYFDKAQSVVYPEPEWLTSDHLLESGALDTPEMDPQSKALIESMFAEEEHYFGHASYVGDPLAYTENIHSANKYEPMRTKSETAGSKSNLEIKRKRTADTAKSIPNRSKWSERENTRLVAAIEKHGYGSWRKVADSLGNRTSKQVAVHTRYLLIHGVQIPGAPAAKIPQADIKPVNTVCSETSIKLENTKTPDIDEDIDVDITDGSDVEVYSKVLLKDPFGNVSDSCNSDINSSTSLGCESDSATEKSDSSFAFTAQEDATGSPNYVTDTQDKNNVVSNRAASHMTSQVNTESKPAEILNSDIPKVSLTEDMTIKTENEPVLSVAASFTKDSTCKIEQIPSESQYTNPMEQTPIYERIAESHSVLSKIKENNTADTTNQDQKTNNAKKVNEDSHDEESDDDLEQCHYLVGDSRQEDFSIDPSIIKPFEMEFCPEWFLGEYTGKRINKTPSRYQKIRNHILDLWAKMRPISVSKSRIRPGLKGQGDVNALSRVHSFLQSIGAINVDCQKPQLKTKRSVAARTAKPKSNLLKNIYGGGEISAVYEGTNNIPTDTNGRRRRKVRTPNGNWVWELEGSTIEHIDPEKEEQRKLLQKNAKYFVDQQCNTKRLKTNKSVVTDIMGKYDPFKLIPLQRYLDNTPHALHVKVHSNTLIIIDFHSHLAHTEIIGLIGGTFDPVKKELNLLQVYPCNSLSTGVQCEMDPVSEMQARDHFNALGLNVVGWYHSHPTFEPNPSIRDIENQANYQKLFCREDGMEPFVGVIVSPFDKRTPVLISRFQFITVSQEWNSMSEYRLPYSCIKSIIPSTSLPQDIFLQISELVRTYRTHPSLVNLSKPFHTRFVVTTRLDKLMNSLESHVILGANQAQTTMFLEKVRDLVERGFSLEHTGSKSTNALE
ncbi:hypothetical protein RTP6_003162 [Batrachochytrium dendrobatidis]